MTTLMSKEKFLEIVSRETFEKLECYVQLLKIWNRSINLVSSKSTQDIWKRHVYDSAQLFYYLPPLTGNIADLGSGAGFPGLILAMMGAREVTLIESDAKKCSFLREVARQTETRVIILNQRIETVTPFKTDVVTSRALAPLPQLLSYAYPFLQDKGIGLFLKGKNLKNEIDQSYRGWRFKSVILESKTSCEGRILRVEDIKQL